MNADLSPVPTSVNTAEADFLAALAQIRHTAPNLNALLIDSLALLMDTLSGSACAYLYLLHEGRLSLAAHYSACSATLTPKLRPDLAIQVIEYLKPITIMLPHPMAYVPILGLPLINNTQPLGALILQADTRVYSAADTSLLQTAATALATALASTTNQPFH